MFQVTVWDYDRFGANEFLGKALRFYLLTFHKLICFVFNYPSVLFVIKQHESKALAQPSRQLTVSGNESEYWVRKQ